MRRRVLRTAAALTPAAVAVVLCAACARYTWYDERDDPRRCPPGLHGSLRVDTLPAAEARAIEGYVLRSRDASPVSDALLQVPNGANRAALGATARSDSAGWFRLVVDAPGRYELITRRVGYARRSDTLTVGERGVRVRVALMEQVIDGPCSGFQIVGVRKPWWKLW